MSYSIDDIRKIAEMVSELGLGKISVKDGENEVVVESKKNKIAPPAMPFAPVQNIEIPVQKEEIAPVSEKTEGNIVKSPIVGTFYSASAPDKPPFVEVGSQVKKGDVIMIIESMKLMNEVQSEFDGKVARILVKNGEAVEYDQPIMIIE